LRIDLISSSHEQASEPGKKMMLKDTGNEIQTQNEETEKNEDPRLLQIGRKDTRKDDQRLKQVTRCNLGYGKTKNPNFFFGFFWIGRKQKRIYGMNLWMLTE
jgi:hypothetical protein